MGCQQKVDHTPDNESDASGSKQIGIRIRNIPGDHAIDRQRVRKSVHNDHGKVGKQYDDAD